MKAIYKRELASYFNSMTGYICVAVMVVFIGIYFMAYNLFAGYPYFSLTLSYALYIFMVAVPILTMRSMSEERHSRTDQLLLTSPVTVTGVVVGKYLAMLTVYLVPVLIAGLCPLILLISSLTESQVIAAVGTFGVLLLLNLWDGLIGYLPTTASGSLLGLFIVLLIVCFLLQSLSNNWKITAAVLVVGAVALFGFYFVDSTSFVGLLPDLLGRFSLVAAFDSFASDHVFDVSGVLLYLSLIALFLFLTVQVIQKRRWN